MSTLRNLTWHNGLVAREEREALLDQRGCVVWLTGLSGSGKSTLARALEKALVEAGRVSYVLDGDNVRHGLNADLGFSPDDRAENVRRVGEVAALFADTGIIAITAFISPYVRGRALARGKVPKGRFVEVYVTAPLSVCEDRDPKGLYGKARAGQIEGFTGVSAPYESPIEPELELPTHQLSVEEGVARIVAFLEERGLMGGGEG